MSPHRNIYRIQPSSSGHDEGHPEADTCQTEGGFPELKILKQKIRNLVSPDMGLGHSDKAGANGHGAVSIPSEKAVEDPVEEGAAQALESGQG
jgi:hypothetical protein